MLSIQHVLSARLQNANFDNSTYMAALIFPDAIRKYSGARQYSHFEKGSDGVDDSSYWEMPTDMKGVSAESIKNNLKVFAHMSESVRPAAIGEDTDIEAFYAHNTHLPEDMHHGVEDHLKQDIGFDAFIRKHIDCSGKYDDTYYFDGKKMDGKEVRSLIGQIEQHGMYVLAHEIYERYGEVTNQAWFESNVKPILDKEYPQDLSETTFSYMKIDPKVNELITNKDWSKLDDGPLPQEAYMELYKDVISSMNKGLSAKEVHRVPQEFQDLADQAAASSVDVGMDFETK